MKIVALATVMACGILAGCGGGGGGGGTTGPPAIPLGTFSVQDTTGSAFQPTVMGAIASGTRVTIYADQRTGPVNAYDTSHRLTLTLYGPVQPGTYPIATSHASGTATAVYLETARQNGSYVNTGTWQGTTGNVVVNAADGKHVEGTFNLATRNSASGNNINWQNGKFSVAYETPPAPPT